MLKADGFKWWLESNDAASCYTDYKGRYACQGVCFVFLEFLNCNFSSHDLNMKFKNVWTWIITKLRTSWKIIKNVLLWFQSNFNTRLCKCQPTASFHPMLSCLYRLYHFSIRKWHWSVLCSCIKSILVLVQHYKIKNMYNIYRKQPEGRAYKCILGTC